jgi:hypothetical protein
MLRKERETECKQSGGYVLGNLVRGRLGPNPTRLEWMVRRGGTVDSPDRRTGARDGGSDGAGSVRVRRGRRGRDGR